MADQTESCKIRSADKAHPANSTDPPCNITRCKLQAPQILSSRNRNRSTMFDEDDLVTLFLLSLLIICAFILQHTKHHLLTQFTSSVTAFCHFGSHLRGNTLRFFYITILYSTAYSSPKSVGMVRVCHITEGATN